MASVKKNYFFIAIYQFLLLFVPLITTPYLTRVLGARSLGVYSYTNSIAHYFTIFIMMGLTIYGSRQIAIVRNDEIELNNSFSEIVSVQLVNGIFFSLIYSIYSLYIFFYEKEIFFITILWGFYVISASLDISWFFSGMENFKLIVIRNLIAKIIVIVGIFSLVSRDGLWIYIFIVSLGDFISQIVLWKNIDKYVKVEFNFDYKKYIKHYKKCLVLFVPVVAVSLYTIVDKIMLGYMSSYEELAFFDNSQKITVLPLAIITSLGTVMLPRISNLISQKSNNNVFEYIGKSMKFTLASSIGVAFGLAAFSPSFSVLYFGPEFSNCGDMIVLLSITIPIIAWANVIRMQYLLPNNMDNVYIFAVMMGAILNIILNILLIPRYNAYGAIVATIATELCVTFIQSYYVKEDLPLLQFSAWGCVFLLVGAVLYYISISIGLCVDSDIIFLLVKAFGWIFIYGMTSIVFFKILPSF
ncbi:Membrane protein involved in the export of O-antigen and teichoic acid [Selenomonas sp. WCT3]|uniref:oligosaccharide flippase family protein n=1 Tax=Selenomonas sp. WCT3 TaxID=3158785 RepID=UPI0008822524|nr:Membrane protein involved in the export of O-antigen and teichoic acid [Selenomonas ruminantium]